MNIFLLNGFPSGEAEKLSLYQALLDRLASMGGDLEILNTDEENLPYCCGTFGCWIKTPGECILGEKCRAIAEKKMHSDLLIFFTPVVFGGYPARLKRAVDHFIPNILPFFKRIYKETHHVKRYQTYPSFLSLGVLPHKDETQQKVFHALFERNCRNFYPPKSACWVFNADEDESLLLDELNSVLPRVGIIQAVQA